MTGPPEYPTPEQIAPALAMAEKHLRDLVERAEDVLNPSVIAMAEQSKSLVSLASWATVLSVSVLQFAQPIGSRLALLLSVSWVLFGATVLIGVASHYYYRDYRSFSMRLANALSEYENAILRTPITPALYDDLKKIDTLSGLAGSHARNVLKISRCNNAMFACFAAGLILLISFAIANGPAFPPSR